MGGNSPEGRCPLMKMWMPPKHQETWLSAVFRVAWEENLENQTTLDSRG